MIRKEDALAYHREGRPGKIEVVATKALQTQRDLSLAYSPGVAEPCREIAKEQGTVGLYTIRRNLVAVVTNGTAVLGLGDIGPYAAKPVMEGKGVLFKKYADIDVFDIEINEKDPDKLIDIIVSLEPTFGGINLEDIKAPDCFKIERALRERMKIPIFHDDQHGTAIISAAAMLNAAFLQEKNLSEVEVLCVGAGASAIACMHHWCRLGVRRENITLIDRHGVVGHARSEPFDESKAAFARPKSDPRRTVEEAIEGADILVGLSNGAVVTPEMVKRMASRPIIFAMANPDPEIGYNEAQAARPDAIVGTGRSDYPNQVNNVLGFPYIFRGALDAGATEINEPMMLAASRALADLARQGVPDDVLAAYEDESIKFGPSYVIPKPMDGRVLSWVSTAVAQAALESGVATVQLDIEKYREELSRKMNQTRRIMWQITQVARQEPRRIVFPEGEEDKILRAAEIVVQEGIAKPVLIARPNVAHERAKVLGVDLSRIEIIDREKLPKMDEYVEAMWLLRRRKGTTRTIARRQLERSRTTYGMMMVQSKDADGLIAGLTDNYPHTIRPALEIIGVRSGIKRAAGMYMVITKDGVKFFADTTINIDPDAESLAEIAILSADLVSDLGIEPRIAMLSFSNFGDAPHSSSRKVAQAAALVKEKRPDLMVDGEMQADVALSEEARALYPFSDLKGAANVLIFPNLDAGNIGYKLLAAIGQGEVIGPFVLGMKRPVNVLQQGASVNTIVNMTAITVAQALRLERASSNPLGSGQGQIPTKTHVRPKSKKEGASVHEHRST